MIVFPLATLQEATPLIQRLAANRVVEEPFQTWAFSSGPSRPGGLIVITGMGPEQAGKGTHYAIVNRGATRVCNAGICGGLTPGFPPGQIFRVSQVTDGDAVLKERPGGRDRTEQKESRTPNVQHPTSNIEVTEERPSRGRGSERDITTGLSGSTGRNGSPRKSNEVTEERSSSGRGFEQQVAPDPSGLLADSGFLQKGNDVAAGQSGLEISLDASEAWQNLITGRLTTVSTPVFGGDRQARLAGQAEGVDMEGFAIAKTCADLGVPCQLLKIVSDSASESGCKELHRNLDACMESLADVIVAGLPLLHA